MSWTHLGDSRPKARIRHRCFLCGEPIVPGETYVRRSGTDGNGLMSFAMHPECKIETTTWDVTTWECFSEGEMDRPKARGS